MPQTADRLSFFTESVIREMTRVANACGAINLSQGFPDADPPPAVLADMQTTNGGNTANVRSTRRDAYSFGVLVSEEQSHDDEVDHCTEAVGYMVFGR